MIALILELIIAIVVNYFAYSWKWWAASIAFPIISKINSLYNENRAMSLTSYRRIIDTILILIQIGYIISHVAIVQIRIGHWYGWLIVEVVGWLGIGIMPPRRWKKEVNNENF